MLHAACDLQEAIDQDEWRHVLFRSIEFVHSFELSSVVADDDLVKQMSSGDRNRNTFYQACARALSFHAKFNKKAPVDPTTLVEFKDTVFAKILAPILTRWWTVGE